MGDVGRSCSRAKSANRALAVSYRLRREHGAPCVCPLPPLPLGKIAKVYDTFVANCIGALECLTRMESSSPVAMFIKACELQERCRGLSLRDFLLMPLQVRRLRAARGHSIDPTLRWRACRGDAHGLQRRVSQTPLRSSRRARSCQETRLDEPGGRGVGKGCEGVVDPDAGVHGQGCAAPNGTVAITPRLSDPRSCLVAGPCPRQRVAQYRKLVESTAENCPPQLAALQNELARNLTIPPGLAEQILHHQREAARDSTVTPRGGSSVSPSEADQSRHMVPSLWS